MRLITTKIIPPTIMGGMIKRTRFLDRIEEVLGARLTTVRAPAGYGKTSVLVQWYEALLERGVSVGWVSLDDSDREAVGLFAYVIAALEKSGIPITPAIKSLIGAESSVTVEMVLATLVDDLLRYAAPVVLFLDDLHLLRDPSVENALVMMVDRVPRSVHFVTASRETFCMPLARARMLGKVFEVTADDLRLSRDETTSFLLKNGHSDLSGDTVESLESQTEGWVAGLKLVALAIKTSGLKSALASFTGRRRGVAEFFAEDVLARYPIELREFLTETSILDRLCPALCDAVTRRRDSRQMLDQIESSGLFLFALDEERVWYRYHHLFADFLYSRLQERQPEACLELHRRASHWLAKEGFALEAFDHAMKAREPKLAATILDRCCFETFYNGQVRILLNLADRLPYETLLQSPRLLLTKAWSLTIHWRFSEARTLISSARARLGQMVLEKLASPEELGRLAFLLLHREMMLAQFEDNMPLVESQCLDLLHRSVNDDPYLAGTVHNSLLYAEREQFRLSNINRLEALGKENLVRSGSRFVIVWHQSIVGPSRFMAGDTDRAIEALEEGVEAAVAVSGTNSPLASIPSLLLAEILYEGNKLSEAKRLCETYLPLAKEMGFVDHLTAGYLTRIRLHQIENDQSRAERFIDEGILFAEAHGFVRLKVNLLAEQITQLLRNGHPAEASRLVRHYELAMERDAVMPKGQLTTRIEAHATIWVRMALARDRLADALAVASQWQSFTERSGAIRAAVRWDILRAQILVRRGDVQAALRTLRRAVVNATHGRFIRSFIDEGKVVANLLTQLFSKSERSPAPGELFGLALLKILGRSEGTCDPAVRGGALPGTLNDRELEILRFIDAGMLNREIGIRLGITEGSVKWYLQQVYDKLGIRRRSLAVQRARQFGMMQ